jgi:hypothetical protein
VAPELLAANSEASPAADMFSLGALVARKLLFMVRRAASQLCQGKRGTQSNPQADCTCCIIRGHALRVHCWREAATLYAGSSSRGPPGSLPAAAAADCGAAAARSRSPAICPGAHLAIVQHFCARAQSGYHVNLDNSVLEALIFGPQIVAEQAAGALAAIGAGTACRRDGSGAAGAAEMTPDVPPPSPMEHLPLQSPIAGLLVQRRRALTPLTDDSMAGVVAAAVSQADVTHTSGCCCCCQRCIVHSVQCRNMQGS